MTIFPKFSRGGPVCPSRDQASRRASMSMAVYGLADLAPEDFCNVIAGAVAARTATRGDVQAHDLENLSNTIGRAAHAKARHDLRSGGGRDAG